MEIADIFVINKSDREGRPIEWKKRFVPCNRWPRAAITGAPAIVRTVATNGTRAVSELASAIEKSCGAPGEARTVTQEEESITGASVWWEMLREQFTGAGDA